MKTNIQIGKLNWSIIIEDPSFSKEETFLVTDCGDTVFLKKKVYINSTMDDDLMYETLKHELTHAYLFSYGFNQVKFDEEVLCDIMAAYGEDIIEASKTILKQWNGKIERKKDDE